MLSERAKAAKRIYQSRWRRKNAEHIKEYSRQWRQANPEKVAAYEARRFERLAEKMGLCEEGEKDVKNK